jgi:dienelactone hydrolase
MIVTEHVLYSNTGSAFEGFLAYDSSQEKRRPLVLVTHTIRGLTPFEEDKAINLAKLGYAAFAVDLYGKGKRGTTPEIARRLMDELNDNRQLLLERMLFSLTCARGFEMVNPDMVGAIGFCFGGKCVLDLARSGESIKGVVSFHGLYDPPGINPDTKIQSAVLILHGWDDPLAPPGDLLALTEELSRKTADWEIDAYGHTGHAFTNPQANVPDKGLYYQKRSSDRAWKKMKSFFEERFIE